MGDILVSRWDDGLVSHGFLRWRGLDCYWNLPYCGGLDNYQQHGPKFLIVIYLKCTENHTGNYSGLHVSGA